MSALKHADVFCVHMSDLVAFDDFVPCSDACEDGQTIPARHDAQSSDMIVVRMCHEHTCERARIDVDSAERVFDLSAGTAAVDKNARVAAFDVGGVAGASAYERTNDHDDWISG